MKTYISDIIPKIQRFSQKLDNQTLITNQHWVVIDEIANSKNVYIFRTNNELLISQNGKVEKAKWEYLGNDFLLIDRGTESYLFKHGFFDENILALKIDSKDEYAILVNETKFTGELNSIDQVSDFLNNTYLNPQTKKNIQLASGINVISNQSYNCPPFDSVHKGTRLGIFCAFNASVDIFEITFNDGLKSEIYVKKKNKEAYFIVRNLPGSSSYYLYDDSNFCITSLHSFLSNQTILNLGFKSSTHSKVFKTLYS